MEPVLRLREEFRPSTDPVFDSFFFIEQLDWVLLKAPEFFFGDTCRDFLKMVA